MHASVESSRVGASALSKSASDNPREMLIRLIEENRDANKEGLFKLFREHLDDENGYRRAVDWYFFINMYEYAMSSRNRKTDPMHRAEVKAQRAEMVEAIVSRMLDLTMPNGKQMRECTGAEMAKFGNRYQKIAERVGKAKTVGSVLNEEEVRIIMR